MHVFLGGLLLSSALVFGQADHLVFSEIVLTPSDGEYVEITNPTANDIDMSDYYLCLLYTSPSPRDLSTSRMPSSA